MSRHINSTGTHLIRNLVFRIQSIVTQNWRDTGLFGTQSHINLFRDQIDLNQRATGLLGYKTFKSTNTANLSRIPVGALGAGGYVNQSHDEHLGSDNSTWGLGDRLITGIRQRCLNQIYEENLQQYRDEHNGEEMPDADVIDMYNISNRYRFAQKTNECYNLANYVSNAIGNGNRLHRALTLLPLINNPSLMNSIDYTQDQDLIENDVAKLLENTLEESLKLPTHLYTNISMGGYPDKSTYQAVYNHFTTTLGGRVLEYFKFRDYEVAVGYGTIIDLKNKKVLAMLTLNPEYLDYYLLKTRSKSKKDLNPAIFDFIIDKDLNSADSIYPSELTRLLRMGVTEALPEGVDVEYVNGSEIFDEIYAEEIKEKEDTLNPLEAIQRNEEMQLAFFDTLEVKTNLKNNHISIVY
tara:strand:- start:20275 stop:21501 length:1227 start_codon:yes stop_codon:yes gene_type:complete